MAIIPNYISDNHWTLDILPQDLYTCYSTNMFMDTQVSLFRYLNQQETSSSETIVYPLVDEAKKLWSKKYYLTKVKPRYQQSYGFYGKLCKCGCGQKIEIRYYHKLKNKKIPEFIVGHNSKGISHYLYNKHHSEETRQKISTSNTKIIKKITKQYCKCGCGRVVNGWNYNSNKPKEFIIGHNHRGIHHSEEWNKKIKLSLINHLCYKDKKRFIKIATKLKGRKLTYDHKNKISIGHKGKIFTLETRKKISESNLGKRQSEETRKKLSAINQKISLSQWKGFIESKNNRIRRSVDFLKWRKIVYERDNYTCRECFKKNIYLNAHHIYPFSKYSELRFDINNGITLCRDCHKNFLGKEEEFIDYFKNKLKG